MLTEINGNIFESKADVIAHGCNCKGAMGRGLALQMRERFPKMYLKYREFCRDGSFRPGSVWLYVAPDSGPIIANLATQDDWGTDAPKARPEWITESLTKCLTWMDGTYTTLAIPRIGCSLGGLTWIAVKPIIEECCAMFRNITVTAYWR
jgi:O-acetyl-ADP-ribose deacetylase (regulator of RNase III)